MARILPYMPQGEPRRVEMPPERGCLERMAGAALVALVYLVLLLAPMAAIAGVVVAVLRFAGVL